MMKYIFPFFIVIIACNNSNKTLDEGANYKSKIFNYNIVNIFLHDTLNFTEGLLIKDGIIYESTGSPEELPFTKSVIGPIDPKTGKIQKKIELDKKFFGEGFVFLKNKIYQLTYKNKVGFIYDDRTYNKINEFTLPSLEGWGMTTDNALCY